MIAKLLNWVKQRKRRAEQRKRLKKICAGCPFENIPDEEHLKECWDCRVNDWHPVKGYIGNENY